MQAGLIILDREQVVAAAVEDGLGDLGLRSRGVDGDERAGECEAFEQKRDGGDLVRLGLAGLLPQHEALAARPCRNHVQRPTVLAAVVGSPRDLAPSRETIISISTAAVVGSPRGLAPAFAQLAGP